MSEIQTLQRRINKLERRMAVSYAIAGLIAAGGLLSITMGMANANLVGENITANRIAMVDKFGNEVMTLGTTNDGRAGIWLKRGNTSNAALIQLKDNTANFWGSQYNVEADYQRDIAVLGRSSQGAAGMWLKRGSSSRNIFLQQNDNTAHYWGKNFFVNDGNRGLATFGTSTAGKGGLWLQRPEGSTWALSIRH